MSMQTDVIYGAGFTVFASNEQLYDFVMSHRETISHLELGRVILEYADRCQEYGDEFDPKGAYYEYVNLMNGNEGFYGLIADVMYKETGVGFTYIVDPEGDSDDVIILPKQMPWEMNDTEKSLTPEKLEEICKKYIQELNPSLTYDSDIRYEYWR